MREGGYSYVTLTRLCPQTQPCLYFFGPLHGPSSIDTPFPDCRVSHFGAQLGPHRSSMTCHLSSSWHVTSERVLVLASPSSVLCTAVQLYRVSSTSGLLLLVIVITGSHPLRQRCVLCIKIFFFFYHWCHSVGMPIVCSHYSCSTSLGECWMSQHRRARTSAVCVTVTVTGLVAAQSTRDRGIT